MGFPTYPAILTDANWQKEKGKFAKAFGGKTGIGAQMIKLHAAASKIDVTKTNCAQAYKNLAEVDAAIKVCKAELAKTDPIRKEAYALRDLAKKVAADFKKNKLIPAASTAHVESVAKEADLFGVTVKSYDPTKDFEAAKARVASNEELQKKVLRDGLTKIATALNGLKGGKATPADYESKAWQAVRGTAAAVARSPELKAVHNDWKVLSSVTKDRLKDADGTAKHVASLDGLVKKTTPLVT